MKYLAIVTRVVHAKSMGKKEEKKKRYLCTAVKIKRFRYTHIMLSESEWIKQGLHTDFQ